MAANHLFRLDRASDEATMYRTCKKLPGFSVAADLS